MHIRCVAFGVDLWSKKLNLYIMKYIYLFLFTASLTIISCDKEDGNVELEEFLLEGNIQVTQLIGDWNWVNSHGGWSYTILTPETEGYNKVVTFGPDRKYKESENSEVLLETYYRIEYIDYSDIHETEYYKIHYFDGKDEQNFFIKQDGDTTSLTLYDPCRDCIGTHVYSKE